MITEIREVLEKHKENIPVVAMAELLAVIDGAEEKVIAELELEKVTAFRTYEAFENRVDLGRIFGLERAIEIVRNGGKE